MNPASGSVLQCLGSREPTDVSKRNQHIPPVSIAARPLKLKQTLSQAARSLRRAALTVQNRASWTILNSSYRLLGPLEAATRILRARQVPKGSWRKHG